ncbi:PAS domain-containing sensor histidine kinase [Acidobacteriota bacterium]
MNFKDWKLKHKIILHVLVIGAITFFLMIYLYIRTHGNIIKTLNRQKAEVVTSMIECSGIHSMKVGKEQEVQSTLQRIVIQSDINSIRILDLQGKVLRSSEEHEKGNIIDGLTLSRMNSFLKENQASLFYNESNSKIVGFRVLRNRQECYECHSPQIKNLGILEVNIDNSANNILFRNNQTKGIIIVFAALATLIFVILRLFEKIINRPIFRLKEEMKKVQEGDLDVQLTPGKGDEIGGLIASFNIMVRTLKDANRKIEELFERQMEKAEHLASIGELAAGLAHDIRNPLAGMKGALEIINQKTEESDPKKEIFTEILLQIDKVNKIIQDLLRYAKPKEMRISKVNPNECIQDAIKLAKPQVGYKEIEFYFKGMEFNTLACIDADKIQEVMLNLMLNSISAIEDKGIIRIVLQKKNNKDLEILFSDNGKGINKDHLSQIFTPFFTTKSKGTGLGLSICKKILEAHNGSIEVESIQKKGTTFVIHLPVLELSC